MTRPLPLRLLAGLAPMAATAVLLLVVAAAPGFAQDQPDTTSSTSTTSSTTASTSVTTSTTALPPTTAAPPTTTRPTTAPPTTVPRPTTTVRPVTSTTVTTVPPTTEAPSTTSSTTTTTQVEVVPLPLPTTTTTLPGDPGEGFTSAQKLRLVVAGLVGIGVAFTVLTVVYWHHTRPERAVERAGERVDEPVGDGSDEVAEPVDAAKSAGTSPPDADTIVAATLAGAGLGARAGGEPAPAFAVLGPKSEDRSSTDTLVVTQDDIDRARASARATGENADPEG